MSSATERLEDRGREDAAQRLARRLDRDLRQRAQRRRSAVFALSLSVVGTLLLVAGLSVAMARENRDADSVRSERIASPAVSEATVSASATEAPATNPESEKVAKPADTPDKASTPAKETARKAPAKPAAKPAKKTATVASGPGILIEKCSGSGCHSRSEVSRGGLDVESAQGAIQAMTDGGYIRLTPAERAAVVTALTR